MRITDNRIRQIIREEVGKAIDLSTIDNAPNGWTPWDEETRDERFKNPAKASFAKFIPPKESKRNAFAIPNGEAARAYSQARKEGFKGSFDEFFSKFKEYDGTLEDFMYNGAYNG